MNRTKHNNAKRPTATPPPNSVNTPLFTYIPGRIAKLMSIPSINPPICEMASVSFPDESRKAIKTMAHTMQVRVDLSPPYF